MSVPEPGTPYKWLCCRTSVFGWDLHLSPAKFMESVEKLRPSVYQTQFPGDWFEDVIQPIPDLIWSDEIEERGDLSNFGAPFVLDGDPYQTGAVVDVDQSMTIETIDPYRGLNHIVMKLDGYSPVDWDAPYPFERHNCVAYKIWDSPPMPAGGWPVMYARCRIKIVEHTTDGVYGIFGLLGVRSGNYMNLLSLDSNRQLRQAWRDDSGGHATVSSTVLSMNVYHDLQVLYLVGNGTGEARVWLDGVEVMDLRHTGLFNTGIGGATELEVGQDEMHVFTAGYATVYYDDIVCASSYIDPAASPETTIPASWYNFYLPSMVNLTQYCHENGIICQILIGNMLNITGVGLEPGFQWYIHSYYQELAAQGIAPPQWLGLDMEWVRIPAQTTAEWKTAIDIIKNIVEGYGSRLMLMYTTTGTLINPLRAVYPWMGHTNYPVTDGLDLVAYEQTQVANGWAATHFGMKIGLLLASQEVYNSWTEANIVHIFNEIDKTSPNFFGVACFDVVYEMLNPIVCPEFTPIVLREAINRGYVIIGAVSLNIADPLYAFTDPNLAVVKAKFEESHAICETFYQGGGYWYGAPYQARFSGRIAIGYMRYIKTTGDKGSGGVYEARTLEALELLLAGQGTNGPLGYWDDTGYETGIGMRAMCEAYLQYGDSRYLQSAIAAGDAVISQNLNLGGNYGAFCVWGLPLLYEITGDARYLDKAVEIASRDAGLMNAEGYWPGDRDGRINYHGVYLRGWVDLLRVIPVNHPFTPTLIEYVSIAASHAINEQHVGGGLYAYPDHRVDNYTDAEGIGYHRENYTRPIEYFGTIDKTFGMPKVRTFVNGLVAYILPFDTAGYVSVFSDTDTYMQKIQMVMVTAEAIEYYRYIPPTPPKPISPWILAIPIGILLLSEWGKK